MNYYNVITREDWDKENSNLINERNKTLTRRFNASNNKRKVYFDMDGVLAKFNKDAPMEEVFSKGYFLNLDPIKGGLNLCKALIEDKNFDVNICSKSSYDAINEKLTWLKKYLPEIDDAHIFLVPLDANKSEYILDQENSILIDDYNKNLSEWKGIAVKFINGINTPTKEFPHIIKGNNVSQSIELLETLVTHRDKGNEEAQYEI